MKSLIATVIANTPEDAAHAGHEMLPLNPWAYGGMMGAFLLVCLFSTFAFRHTGTKH